MWKWFNPWRELRQAREHIAALEAECDALDREARDARRVAYAEAHEYYKIQTKALQASHDQLLQRHVDMQNMAPPYTYTLPKDMFATTSGVDRGLTKPRGTSGEHS